MAALGFSLLLLPLGLLLLPLSLASEGCCPEKQVTGSDGALAGTYRLLLGQTPTEFPSDCRDKCVYRREGDSTNYCFVAGGPMKSTCEEGEVGFTTALPPIGGQEGLSNEKFCEMDKTHTMCVYPGVGSKCLADPKFMNGFSDTGKSLIVDKHNELRGRVARGDEPGQPKAANMREVVWSDELAAVAQRWADQCDFGHDKNRKKLDGTAVGQNAYMGMSSRVKTIEEMMAGVDVAASAWYGEVTKPGFDPANIKPFKFVYGAGHYTQVVWADTDEVGCGWSYYSDGGWQKSYVVCNYAISGNWMGGTMYKEGEPCSACPDGLACRPAQGLCGKPEVE